MKTQLAITLLLIFQISTTQSQTDKRLKGIEKEFNRILEETKAPGFAVAVVDRDKIVYAKGFGLRDVENKIPMDENTLLAIGSSSKAFTSAILGQLRDEGELTFDDSPIDYVKELRFYNDELNNGINIRDLMSHQTGIPRHDGSWYLFPTYNKDSLIQRIKHHEPFTGLRREWRYNNFMFLLQGVIAERITGKSWEDNVRERFFIPLGMKRSNLSIEELEKADNIAIGYYLDKDSISKKTDYYRIAGMAPAGSINSSVKEMCNWLKVWINDGKFNGEQILPENYLREAKSSQAVIAGALPSKENPDVFMANYGYGWMLRSYKGHYRVEHGGNIDGFSASVSFYPTDSIGVVVLANQSASDVPTLVRNTVTDRMLNVNKSDWVEWLAERKESSPEAEEEEEEEEEMSTTPTHELKSYTGSYSHPGYGTFKITLREDSLFVQLKRMTLYLKHVQHNIFQPYEVSEDGLDITEDGFWKLNFDINNEGEISSVRIDMEPSIGHPIKFDREPEIVNVDKSEMTLYEGEYEVAGTTVKVYTKVDDELYLFVPGQPEYHLLATDFNKFRIEDLDGFKIEFSANNEGQVSEMIMIQPNGTFKAQKK